MQVQALRETRSKSAEKTSGENQHVGRCRLRVSENLRIRISGAPRVASTELTKQMLPTSSHVLPGVPCDPVCSVQMSLCKVQGRDRTPAVAGSPAEPHGNRRKCEPQSLLRRMTAPGFVRPRS